MKQFLNRPPRMWVLCVALLFLSGCSSKEERSVEKDTLLVTLLGVDIEIAEYAELQVEEGDEADRMREHLAAEDWALWAECAHWRPLRQRIHDALMQHFVEEHELLPTKQEVADYIEYVNIQPMRIRMPDMEVPPMPSEDSQEWRRAFGELSAWKTQNTLYDQYGGRIAVDRAKMWVAALDAYERFLRDCENKGLLTFHSESFRDVFWNCIARDEIQYPRDYVVPGENEGVKTLREHPGTRRLRVLVERLSRVMDDSWSETFEQIEHPPGWPGR